MEISVVVPVFNEQENVRALHAEIVTSLESDFERYEIIFVNDGSTDNTLNELKTLTPIKILTLSKNCGQTAAISLGLELTTLQHVALLDGDGQNDPKDIIRLYQKLKDDGLDAACGWRISRKDKFSKRLISKGAFKLRSKLAPDNIHDSGCTLKVMTSEAAKSLKLRGELHRFISSILVMNGYRISELPVNHRPRKFGKTKYNWRRIGKGYLDMLTLWFWNRFSRRPMHFFGAAAIILFGFGVLMFAFSIFSYFILSGTFKNVVLLVSITLFLFSSQTFLIGLLSEYLVRIQINTLDEQFVKTSSLINK